MTELFAEVIRAYGKELICRRQDGTEAGRGMAIVRPMTRRERQSAGGALGAERTDSFLGLAEPGTPVEAIGPGGWLEWSGQRFEALTCQPIPVGDMVTHLWLALRPCGETAP